MEILNQKQKIIVFIIIIAIIGVVGYYYINSTKELYSYEEINDIVETNETEENIIDNEDANLELKQKEIVVHIAGEVKNNRDCKN